jgi:hypothetical protein
MCGLAVLVGGLEWDSSPAYEAGFDDIPGRASGHLRDLAADRASSGTGAARDGRVPSKG